MSEEVSLEFAAPIVLNFVSGVGREKSFFVGHRPGRATDLSNSIESLYLS